jgi:hypothetical protein
MASTYYDSSGKSVIDGDIAYAADLNDINSAVDTALQQVESDIAAITVNQPYYSILAQKWAEEVEDTPVTVGHYSALHWAAKAEDQAILADADRVQTGLDRTQTGLDRAATGQDKIATAADRVQTGLDRVATAADAAQTALDAIATAADVVTTTALAALIPTPASGDEGKYIKVANPFGGGYELGTLNLTGYAPLASPTFTGVPAAPTAAATTNTTQVATTAFAQAAIAADNIKILHVADEKSEGTNGGTSSAGMNTRVLQTVIGTNNITGASLGSNQITLPAGTFHISASAFAIKGGTHKLRLYNTTTAAYIGEGTSEISNTAYSNSVKSFLNIIVTFASPQVLELRHYISSGLASTGLGAAVGSGVERYAEVIIREL